MTDLMTAQDWLTPAGQWLASYLPQQPLMIPPWFGCLHWAIGEPDILDAFRTETGLQWTPGRTPLERMIDDATGMDRVFLETFLVWFNATIWGDLDKGSA